MLTETRDSLTNVATALENLNRALEAELADMEKNGTPAAKIEHVRAGVKAIKDCGNMLMIWSDYIARGDLGSEPDDPEARRDPFPR